MSESVTGFVLTTLVSSEMEFLKHLDRALKNLVKANLPAGIKPVERAKSMPQWTLYPDTETCRAMFGYGGETRGLFVCLSIQDYENVAPGKKRTFSLGDSGAGREIIKQICEYLATVGYTVYYRESSVCDRYEFEKVEVKEESAPAED